MGTNISATAMTCQDIDNSENFTNYGVRSTQKIGNFSLGSEAGIFSSTKVDENTNEIRTNYGVYTDIRGSIPYGETCLSGGFRIRTKEGNSQFRLQPTTISFKVGDNTNIYATPYGVSNLDYATGTFSDPKIGFFAGVNCKLHFGPSIFCEYQAYDISKINPSNSSINIGVSIPLK
ncbi:MAG: hypothetical protein E7Z87_08055 [Cyanobacteria bacterium SIG26]|nr:hypothetical protein [Cyanobacteria bacterium SIG26]